MINQLKSRIQLRVDALSNWVNENIVLLSGEVAVVNCENQTKFKVGNGVSSFNELPFVDENVLSTIWVTAHAISQGTQAYSTPFGLAAGYRLSANADYSQAMGFKSQTSVGHSFSFTWNGDDSTYNILGNDYYSSHGKGTFNINPLSGLSGVYVGEQNLAQILSESGCKVFIDDRISSISQMQSELSIVKLSVDEYEQLVAEGQVLSNCLYIVEDDAMDMYGQQIKNLSSPTDLSDAANKEYVDNISTAISTDYQSKIDGISNDVEDISSQISSLSDTYATKEYVDDGISSVQEDVDGKVFVDGLSTDSLSIVHISEDDYHTKVTTSATLSNELYIVSSDYINAYGEQIKNLSAGTISSDAATYGQLTSAIANVHVPLSVSELVNDSGYLTSCISSVSATYANQHIKLSANGDVVGDVDCADFIKDGMLSSVELCSGQLVFNFNTDAGQNAISVALSNFIDETNYWTKSETSSAVEISSALERKSTVTFVEWED